MKGNSLILALGCVALAAITSFGMGGNSFARLFSVEV